MKDFPPDENPFEAIEDVCKDEGAESKFNFPFFRIDRENIESKLTINIVWEARFNFEKIKSNLSGNV